MTELIRQRTTYDCAVCTIAMATGFSYEVVHYAGVLSGGFDPDKGCRSEQAVLEKLGVSPDTFKCYYREWCISPEFYREMTWGRRAIMAVPSLNKEGGFHSVYWTGRELLDPCTQKTYTEWGQLLPAELVLFVETAA